MTKALSLSNPWAQLVAEGVKAVETRSWRTRHRGPLVIVSTKAEPTQARIGGWFAFPKAVHGRGRTEWVLRHEDGNLGAGLNDRPMPLGAVVASCRLADVVPILDGDEATEADIAVLPYPRVESYVNEDEFPDGWLELWHPRLGNPVEPERSGLSIPQQAPFGDFSPGRFAWLFEDVKPTTERCPACWGTGEIVAAMEGVTAPGVKWEPASEFHPTCLEAERRAGRVSTCPTCEGEGRCDPVPARGRQGLWEWTP